MREFFRGWRRKAGCVALVMACALMGAWIRSRAISDRIVIRRYGHITEYLVSELSGFGWKKEIEWSLIAAGGVVTDVPYCEWLGFKYGMRFAPEASLGLVAKVNVRIVPYWALTVPLTLLSAYLILWKPRTKPKEHHHA
jgi:hypothetical protein